MISLKKIVISLCTLSLLLCFGVPNAWPDSGKAVFDFFHDLKAIDAETLNEFRPSHLLNKAELIKLLVHANGYTKKEAISCITDQQKRNWRYVYFSDVEKEAWYAPYVCFAEERGWLEERTLFKPASTISWYKGVQLITKILEDTGRQSLYKPRMTAAEVTVFLKKYDFIPPSPFDQMTRMEFIELAYKVLEAQQVVPVSEIEEQEVKEKTEGGLTAEEKAREATRQRIIKYHIPGTGGGGGGGGSSSSSGTSSPAPSAPFCGNWILETGEACEDGNRLVETCNYGTKVCTVCGSNCQIVSGITSYCGDGIVDTANGEACDGGADCTSNCTLSEPPVPTIEIEEVSGSIEAYLAELKNKIIPIATEEYLVPSAQNLADFKEALHAFLIGDEMVALPIFDQLGYKVVRLTDGASTYTIFEEKILDAQGNNDKGWGTLILNFSADTNAPLVISVPHPYWDQNTPELGLEIFKLNEAYAFLMAGASRYANAALTSDQNSVTEVALNTQSVFHAVSEVLASPGALHFQVHGYANEKHPVFYDEMEIILSSGSVTSISTVQQNIADHLTLNGFIFENCGDNWNTLCGTLNVQGQFINSSPGVYGQFIHIEVEASIRFDSNRITELAESLF